MKLLFIQTPTSHLGAKEIVYPIGLSRLAALVPADFEKYSLDMNLYADPYQALKERLDGLQPDMALLSFRNLDPLAGIQGSYFPSLKTTAMMIRTLSPKTMIIAGGPAFSLFGKRLVTEVPEIDCGIIGEGEVPFRQMMEGSTHHRDIPGLLWQDSTRLMENPRAGLINPLELSTPDTLSFPPGDYLKENHYVAAIGIEGKRGCDLNCAYCVYPQIGGHKMRLRSPKAIVDEMEFFHKAHHVDLFHFTDSVVNRPLGHFLSLCEELISRKIAVSWTGFFREDTFTKQAASLAMKAGLVACYFSADALTDHGLMLLKKQLVKEDIFKACKICVDKNLLTMHHFLVNLPFEAPDGISESRETLLRILDIHHKKGNLGAVIFNNVRLYPGAPLTKKLIGKQCLSAQADLLYPIYHNPVETAHHRFELESICHSAGVFSRFGLPAPTKREDHAGLCT